MFGKTTLCFSTLLAFAAAQSAPCFPISASQWLTVAFGNNTVSPPGIDFTWRYKPRNPPSISSPVWPADENGPRSGVLLMVDLDVPRDNSRVQLLHWLATNATLGSSISSSSTPLNVPVGQVPYLQPSPPVGDVPHSYTFMVFPQPANFLIPAQYAGLVQNRVGFNTSQFVKDVGLGTALVAYHIRVQNPTSIPTTTYPPARPTGSAARNPSAPIPFPGVAQPLMDGGVTFWARLSTALLSGVAAIAL